MPLALVVALMLSLAAQRGWCVIPATDLCRRYSTACDLCASFEGCYWCGGANSSAVCVENFVTIRSDCPLLILTQSFCATEGLSFTPPPSSLEALSLRSPTGLATLAATVVLILVMLLLSCFTFMFCPNKCGGAPAWCCGCCPKAFRSL